MFIGVLAILQDLTPRFFVHSNASEALVSLGRPRAAHAKRWGVNAQAPAVRLIRQISPNGQIRVLMTNVAGELAAAEHFSALYHQRWRIEEAFKRLKHRLHLECVSGLTQHALELDVAAKVLADNVAALLCIAVTEIGEFETKHKRCNRAYLAQALSRWLPRWIMRVPGALAELLALLALLLHRTHRVVQRAPRVRPDTRSHHEKHHPSICYR